MIALLMCVGIGGANAATTTKYNVRTNGLPARLRLTPVIPVDTGTKAVAGLDGKVIALIANKMPIIELYCVTTGPNVRGTDGIWTTRWDEVLVGVSKRANSQGYISDALINTPKNVDPSQLKGSLGKPVSVCK